MFNPVITPELALMLKRGEVEDISEAEMLHDELHALMLDDADELIEHMATWDEIGFTVDEEAEDLAASTMPSAFDKYMPNDGTPAIERRLRKQGFRKVDDSDREEVHELYVEVGVLANRRIGRMHILRQKGGDKIIT